MLELHKLEWLQQVIVLGIADITLYDECKNLGH